MREFYMERGEILGPGPNNTSRVVPDPDPLHATYKIDGVEVTRDEFEREAVAGGFIAHTSAEIAAAREVCQEVVSRIGAFQDDWLQKHPDQDRADALAAAIMMEVALYGRAPAFDVLRTAGVPVFDRKPH